MNRGTSWQRKLGLGLMGLGIVAVVSILEFAAWQTGNLGGLFMTGLLAFLGGFWLYLFH